MEKSVERTIEDIIDKHHLSDIFLKNERGTAVLNALRVFEDGIKFAPSIFEARGLISKKLSDKDLVINNFIDGLDQTIKWIYECCPYGVSSVEIDYNGKLYFAASQTFIQSMMYGRICDGYTLLSRGRQIVEYNEENNQLIFKFKNGDQGKREAADLVLAQNTKEDNLVKALKAIPDNIINCFNLEKEIYFNDQGLQYDISEAKLNSFELISKAQVEYFSELPEDWKMHGFTLGEFRKVWEVLLRKSLIHEAACKSSKKEGGAIEYIVMITTFEDLSKEITDKSKVANEQVRLILETLLYDASITNGHVIWQPIIPLDDINIAIPPNLIINSNFERNLIYLLNKIAQGDYSRLSNLKEDIMLGDLSEKLKYYSNISVSTAKKLPDPLPDMDLILYDKNRKVLFLSEIKWLLSIDSIKEICARDKDLEKGISQAKLIKEYALKNTSDVLERAFGQNDLEVNQIYSCVISKNNIGSSFIDSSAKIINEASFLKILADTNGDLLEVIRIIDNNLFLPKEGVDYNLNEIEISYGNQNFIVQSVSLNTEKVNLPPIKKEEGRIKLRRNDPCFCGKINEKTGKVYKYKKCCG
ncbi:SEC-C domain-containing protein [Psychrobacillus sp. FSL K6-2836]|uniref:YecA family protein n=1 Tax=Psychrobacillus sp. FSL K6-2836 TaxID=2921548 RepID=UPI0030F8F627